MSAGLLGGTGSSQHRGPKGKGGRGETGQVGEYRVLSGSGPVPGGTPYGAGVAKQGDLEQETLPN